MFGLGCLPLPQAVELVGRAPEADGSSAVGALQRGVQLLTAPFVHGIAAVLNLVGLLAPDAPAGALLGQSEAADAWAAGGASPGHDVSNVDMRQSRQARQAAWGVAAQQQQAQRRSMAAAASSLAGASHRGSGAHAVEAQPAPAEPADSTAPQQAQWQGAVSASCCLLLLLAVSMLLLCLSGHALLHLIVLLSPALLPRACCLPCWCCTSMQ